MKTSRNVFGVTTIFDVAAARAVKVDVAGSETPGRT